MLFTDSTASVLFIAFPSCYASLLLISFYRFTVFFPHFMFMQCNDNVLCISLYTVHGPASNGQSPIPSLMSLYIWMASARSTREAMGDRTQWGNAEDGKRLTDSLYIVGPALQSIGDWWEYMDHLGIFIYVSISTHNFSKYTATRRLDRTHW